MLKSKGSKKCPCKSGRLYRDCCGNPVIQELTKAAEAKPCGECQACCHHVGVIELGKPYAHDCKHQCETGCAIYNLRPNSCKIYNCYWKILPGIPDEWRPDKSGVMLHADVYDATRTKAGLFVYEVRPDAFYTMSAEIGPWLENYSKVTGKPVILVKYGIREGTGYHINTDDYPVKDTFEKILHLIPTEYGKIMVLVDDSANDAHIDAAQEQ